MHKIKGVITFIKNGAEKQLFFAFTYETKEDFTRAMETNAKIIWEQIDAR